MYTFYKNMCRMYMQIRAYWPLPWGLTECKPIQTAHIIHHLFRVPWFTSGFK